MVEDGDGDSLVGADNHVVKEAHLVFSSMFWK
jgi:hypothetical protein